MNLLYAETNTERLSIKEMIKEIQNAPEAERFAKMNRFKQYLRTMNSKNRKKAILALQKSLKTKIKESEKKESLDQTKLQESQEQLQMQQQIQNQMQLKKNITNNSQRKR